MIETNDVKFVPDEVPTNQSPNISPNVSNLLEIKLSLSVGVPKDEKKNLNKVERCGAVVYNFLRRIDGMTLPPGKFETPYDFSIDFKDVVSVEGVIVKAALESCSSEFEANGLNCRYENDKLSISGTPQNPNGFDGNVQIRIEGRFTDVKTFEKKDGFPVRCCFTVDSSFTTSLSKKKFVLNPDPDSLWEDNPTPENAPFKKTNADVWSGTTAAIPALTVLGASQRGRSHAQIGSFRDDHFLVRLGENLDDWNFVAVADGAGSARFSREGSKIACESCIDDPKTGLATLFKTHYETLNREITSIIEGSPNSFDGDFSSKLPQTNLQKLFFYSVRYAGEAIVNASKQANAKLSDFNTTFLCAAFKRLPKTEQAPARWIVLSYWVGDGGLAIFRPNGKNDVLALGTPDGGEFAGQTRFLTMKSELEEKAICGRLRLAVVEDFQALVLATDGITDPFFPAEANLSDYVYWEKFWNETLPKEFPGVLDAKKTLEERGQALLSGLKFKSKGNHDDRTLVLVLNDAFGRRLEMEDETSDSQEEEIGSNTGTACGKVNDVETPNSAIALQKNVDTEKEADVPNVEVPVSETPTEELAPPPSEIALSVSETPTEELAPPLSEITPPVSETPTEKLAPSLSEITSPVSETPTEELAPPPSEIVLSVSETPTEELAPLPSEIVPTVSETSTEELAPPPSEIALPVSETPAEELAPPPSEIVVIPDQESADEDALPDFCSDELNSN